MISKIKTILTIIGVILLIVAGYFLWQKFHPAQSVTIETQQTAETTQGVEKAADNANLNISTDQATEIAKEIKAVQQKSPDSVVVTTVSNLSKTVTEQKEKAGADFAILTADTESIKASTSNQSTTDTIKNVLQGTSLTTQVTLKQYNIKAYPLHLVEGTIYTDNSFDMAYLMRVKIFKATGYVGPAVQHDTNKTRIGARVSIPI